jgi:hypothetical protein
MADKPTREDYPLTCPFCGDVDFDAVGLKAHLERWCDAYRSVPTLEQEMEARNGR